MFALNGAGEFLEKFGGNSAMQRSIRFPADEGHRTIPPCVCGVPFDGPVSLCQG